MARKEPADIRFWRRVEKAGAAECWRWTGTVNASGYGNIHVGGKQVYTHRFSWELHNGPITNGLWVLHRCDNPVCVNPTHLFLGTHADNMADKARKGRSMIGEANPGAKLTAAQVLAIRASPLRPKDIAKQFGVTPKYIGQIRNRETWARVMSSEPTTP